MSIREMLLAGACVLALAACGGGDEDAAEMDAAGSETLDEVPSAEGAASMADEERAAAAAETLAATEAYLEENAARDGVMVTDTGVQVETLEEGDGQSPSLQDYVTLHYTAKHIDGEVFDSSIERDEPVMQALERFLPGLRDGVLTMEEGGKASIVIPPARAFGERGTPDGTIAPNEAVIFEVELLDVTTVEELEAQYEELAAGNAEASARFLEENAEKDGVMQTESGLQYEVVEEGEGDRSPVPTDIVTVNYRGTLIDGTVFDSSYDRGEPTQFPLNRVIPGWTEGLQLMSVGDTYRFYLPPEIAYGESGGGSIGPNQALIFDVELLDVQAPEAGPAAETPE